MYVQLELELSRELEADQGKISKCFVSVLRILFLCRTCKDLFPTVLVHSDLWDIVTEEPSPDNEEEGGSTISKWKKRNRKAQAEISLHLSDSHLPLVMRLKMSKDYIGYTEKPV